MKKINSYILLQTFQSYKLSSGSYVVAQWVTEDEMTLNNPFHGPGLFLCPLGEGSWFSNLFQGVYIERDQCHGMGEKYF